MGGHGRGGNNVRYQMMNPNSYGNYNEMMGGSALEGATGYDPLLGF